MPAPVTVPPFVPPWWLRDGHSQTLTALLHRPGAGDLGESVRIPIDAGTLGGHLHRAPAGSDACVIVLHGIGGSAHEPFVVRTARGAAERGLNALRVHLRGAGASVDPAYAGLFHSGLTSDIRAVVEWAAAWHRRVHLVGFSLGGQIALRTAGEWGTAAPAALRSVAAVSAPVDLSETADFAERTRATPYRVAIVRGLKQRFEAARRSMGPAWAKVSLRDVRTIRQFDEAVTSRFFGYRDVADYYARAGSGAVLAHIARPTLLVHADDDPLVPVAPVRRLARDLPLVHTLFSSRGGHVGFYGASVAPGDRTRFWSEQRALDWVTAHDAPTG
jgi:hypothetical protein